MDKGNGGGDEGAIGEQNIKSGEYLTGSSSCGIKVGVLNKVQARRSF